MSTIHLHKNTTLTPEQFIAGLTDFSPGRSTDVVVVRDGKNAQGRILGLVLGTAGKGVLVTAFGQSVDAIEARNNGPAAR